MFETGQMSDITIKVDIFITGNIRLQLGNIFSDLGSMFENQNMFEIGLLFLIVSNPILSRLSS